MCYDPAIVVDIYKKLLYIDVSVYKSPFPEAFMSTLEFTGNTARISANDLCRSFWLWTYKGAQTTVNTAYMYSTTHYLTPISIWLSALASRFKRQNHTVPIVGDIPTTFEEIPVENAYQATYNELMKDIATSSNQTTAMNEAIQETGTILEASNEVSIISSKLEEVFKTCNTFHTPVDITHVDYTKKINVPITLPTVTSAQDEIEEDIIDRAKDIKNVRPGISTSSRATKQPVTPLLDAAEEKHVDFSDFEAVDTHYSLKDFDFNLKDDPFIDAYVVICGNRASSFRATLCMEYEYISKTNIPDHIEENYNMLVRSTHPNSHECKAGIACLSAAHWDAINNLPDIGITDCTISDVVYFPSSKHIDNIASDILLPVSESLSEYMRGVYYLRKYMVPRTIKGATIKEVMSCLYGNYGYSYGKSISVHRVHIECNFSSQQSRQSRPTDFKEFCDVILYLGYMIKDNHIMNIDKLPKRVDVSFTDCTDPLSIPRTIDSNKIKNLQLRSNPPIKMMSNLPPWNISGHISPLKYDLNINKKPNLLKELAYIRI